MKTGDTPALLPSGRMYARPGFGNKLKLPLKPYCQKIIGLAS
jgi:hypothetical protein